jgi:bifunctional non-homologous end joining protein LigD
MEAGRGKATLPFCIQKHAASHLHYDFRLGWNGVLKSWAVAKGPSYVVRDKRLAVQVEDHPIEYGGFEGIIPQGQYGGGTVLLWDQGTWAPQAGHEDIDEGLRTGSLKFVLYGTKMHGKWALIRMGGKAATERKPNWLLIKEHDDFERGQDDPSVTETEVHSVVTGRTMDEIGAEQDHVWNSKDTARGKAWFRQKARLGHDLHAVPATVPHGSGEHDAAKSRPPMDGRSTPRSFVQKLKTLPEEQQPEFVQPQLATQAEQSPESEAWLHELKLDGYRMQARKAGDRVQMLTRSGLDWTARMQAIASEVARLPVQNATLDGEVVVLTENGTTNFADLQAAFMEGARSPLTYFCFDLLHVDGRSTRELPLIDRKSLLEDLLQGTDANTLRISEHLTGHGPEMFAKACDLQVEGIISKRVAALYSAGRGRDWLKLKCVHEQEFVIGGFTLPSNGTHGIGALLLGYYEDGRLVYAGRTGTGFTQKLHKLIRDRLEPLRVAQAAFAAVNAEARRGAIWVKPELVAQVRFATWTADQQLRQASFLGLREDKPASDVRREEPTMRRKHAARDPSPARQNDDETSAKEVETRKERAIHTSDIRESVAAKQVAAPAELEHAPVRLTHPDKVLDAETKVTKRQLSDYLWAVSEWMLPHIADRPLSLVRCPEGSSKPCFFQKHVNHMLPPGVGSVPVPDKKTGVLEDYISLDSREALAGLAQMGVLEVHPWGSRNEDLEHPDRLTIDLDPDESLAWTVLAEAALQVRERLKALGLKSWVKTTGGKGLHVVVPVEPGLAWPEAKEFTHAFVRSMEREQPSLYLTKMTKSARAGKIYLDYLRNERGATAVAPYSPRARSGMGVSVPLQWKELSTGKMPAFRLADFSMWRARLDRNPWKDFAARGQQISDAMQAALGVRIK